MDVNPQGKQELLTIGDVAEILKFSISRIRYEVSIGRLPYIKIGKSIRFDRKTVEEWVRKHEVSNG